MNDYEQFLAGKAIVAKSTGLKRVGKLNPKLFEFQHDIVSWALRRGRSAILADCGLGKSPMQLVWGDGIQKHTKGTGLLLAPLGVTRQTVFDEAPKFGIENIRICESQADVKKGINVTNYQKLHKFKPSKFDFVILDESGILKSLDGKYRTDIIRDFRDTPFKLAATATPSPNSYMELGSHAEFLGIMSYTEMLSTFFAHDGGETSQWRLKGHAEGEFFKWLCSWAVNIRKPSDLGYEDGDFKLPPLKVITHVIATLGVQDGFLFQMPAHTLNERRAARKASLSDRAKKTAELVENTAGKCLVWCDRNDEQDQLEKLLGDSCVSIRGATPDEKRLEYEHEWRLGSKKTLLSKGSVFGWGMNWQHCGNEFFCGLSDSWEQFYQSVRRCYRFGRKDPVTVNIIISSLEDAVLQNIKRKEKDADRMALEMVRHMAAISSKEIKGVTRETTEYNPQKPIFIPEWLQSEAA